MLYDNKKWIEDIDKVIEVVPELDDLAGKSLMITGAAGLVCSAVVDIIFRYNDTHDKKIQVLAAGRWPEEMSGRFGELVNRDDFILQAGACNQGWQALHDPEVPFHDR